MRVGTGQRLLIVPMVALIVGLLFAPILVGLWNSFHSSGIYQVESNLTLDNYRDVFDNQAFWSALRTSSLIGLTTAVLSVVLGYWLAHYIRFTRPGSARFVFAILLLSLVGGYLVRIYAWRTLLGEGGVVNSALIRSGVTDEPVSGLLFSPFAIILALGSIYLPYAALMVSAGLSNVADEEVEAARDLGASRFKAYRGIVLPMLGRTMLLSFVLIFLLSAADYVMPQLLGGARTQMIGALVVNALVGGGNLGLGAAIAFTAMLAFGLIIALTWLAVRAVGLLPRGASS